jgi:PBP1b-binding outer membrane lipoprotein LpoB
MKKNSLVFALFLMGALAFTSCKNDVSVSNSLKGKYNVKVSEINLKDLEDASKQIKEEMEKGKVELHGDLEKAQAELDKEVNIEIDGKKVDLKEAIGDMSQGLEKMMDGLGDMGNGLGKGISELLIKNTNFQVDFRDDGALAIGSDNNKFNFSSKNLTWEIKDGKLIIKDKDKSKEDFSFELKSKNDKEWELVSDKIKLSLNKAK